MLESFTYLDWSSLLIHLSGIIFHISLQTQLLQDVGETEQAFYINEN